MLKEQGILQLFLRLTAPCSVDEKQRIVLGLTNRPAIALDPNRLAPVVSDSTGASSALYNAHISSALTWGDISWLRSAAGRLPVVLKGILAPEDAARAVLAGRWIGILFQLLVLLHIPLNIEISSAAGVAAIWISNHGGRQLDAAVASLDVLPSCVAAVRATEAVMPHDGRYQRVEVWFDGGVRTGGDVVKALALGADFVFVGRPALWGLAVAGSDGTRGVMEVIGAEVRSTLQLLGVRSLREIGRSHVKPILGDMAQPRL